MNPCVFLDRDGVINKDNPNYTYKVEGFEILPGVIDALKLLKANNFSLVVVTNQSGIAQGLYTQQQMQECHRYFQEQSGHVIDHFYFSPYHPSVTDSLLRKPGTLMFEKAIARFNVDIAKSWMIGDRGRDIIPARKLGIKTIQIGDEIEEKDKADFQSANLLEAANIILSGI
ncbi:MAG: HAD family hydrolase [Bacteroidetes bacterium]|nr:HAD family hydrolase [Bacteroidota bacterium]